MIQVPDPNVHRIDSITFPEDFNYRARELAELKCKNTAELNRARPEYANTPNGKDIEAQARGILGEMIVRHACDKWIKQYIAPPLESLASGDAAIAADLILYEDGQKLPCEIKTIGNSQNEMRVNTESHAKKKDVKFYIFVFITGRTTAELFECRAEVVTKWEIDTRYERPRYFLKATRYSMPENHVRV